MKIKITNIITWCISLLLVLSCRSNETTLPATSTEEIFDFYITLPDMRAIPTRANVENGMITNMFILVFDQNGSFLSRTEATQTGPDPSDYRIRMIPTDPSLPPDEKKRIVHFVANQDWSTFSDAKSLGLHENDVILNLSATGNETIYWQRIELIDGIKAGIFSSPIELIGNKARISVINNSGIDSESGQIILSDVSFALGDYLDCGTIAPFDITNLLFDENGVIESQYANRLKIEEGDFVPAGDGVVVSSIIECYEHANAISKKPMYIILKGRFTGETDYSYYKIDIVPTNQIELLNIQRNCHYIIDIQSVMASGSKSLSEVIEKPASNNLIYSVLLEKYTSISYNDAALYVETTDRIFVRTGQIFRIGFSYFPDINSTEDNSTIQVALENEDHANPVVDNYSFTTTPGNAYIEGTTAATLPPFGYYNAKFIISSNESGVLLRRVINIRLRQPSLFDNPYIFPAIIPNTAGQNVDLHFTIPNTVQDVNFPMDVYITTTILMPNLATGYDSGLTLDYSKAGSYRYKYIAKQQGAHTVYFKTIIQQAPEGTLTLESELFAPVNISLGP